MIRISLAKRLSPHESITSKVVIFLIAILVALSLGAVLFLSAGANPFDAYLSLLQSGFFSLRGIGFTLVQATPLILVSLATIVAWRSGFMYLGFEGAMLIGAAGSTVVGLSASTGGLLDSASVFVVLPLALLAGMAAAGFWAFLVGIIQVRSGGNTVLIALMSNYVAILLIQYLVSGPMRAAGDLPQTALISRDYWLPILIPGTRLHAGILIALCAAAIIYFALEKTAAGFELVAIGMSARVARYGGVNVERRILQAAFAAGALSGLAGAVNVYGVHHRLLDGFADGTGFVGIVTALLGQMTVGGSVLASILYGGLTVGADAMQRQSGLPSAAILSVQAMIVLCILGSEIYRTHILRIRVRKKLNGGA